jgi:hypothetical protein
MDCSPLGIQLRIQRCLPATPHSHQEVSRRRTGRPADGAVPTNVVLNELGFRHRDMSDAHLRRASVRQQFWHKDIFMRSNARYGCIPEQVCGNCVDPVQVRNTADPGL